MISLKKFLADELPKLYRQIPDHKVLERVKDALKSGNRAVRDKLREGTPNIILAVRKDEKKSRSVVERVRVDLSQRGRCSALVK
jgi:hypothetical protein